VTTRECATESRDWGTEPDSRKLSNPPRFHSAGRTTKIAECEFPDDLLYDPGGLTWAREEDGEVVVGITAIQAAVAGKVTSVTARPVGGEYARGRVIGTLESGKYFGTVKTPVAGILVAVNEAVLRRSKLLSESPYREGWFARVRPAQWTEDREPLLPIQAANGGLASLIETLHVRCFAAFPDYEMYEIGTECAAVLVKLNELLSRMEVGEVVHIVSDDWTAPIEMDRWSTETGHPVADARKEGNLYHFLVRKVR